MDSSTRFIETQLPVSKLSKESYKERKANHGQTLTGLGKWWGRKPLILVRGTILGLLLPSTDDPQKDREVYLRLMTMDEDGLWLRKNKSLSAKEAYELLTPRERLDWFAVSAEGKVSFKRGLTADDKERVQKRAFLRLNYDQKLEYCARPEEIGGPSEESWIIINEHLGTSANSLQELIQQLGERQFGHTPRVGDAFCGGGSIPFEAARMGCDAYGSDLSPVAALLTWASLNIIGGGQEAADSVRKALQTVYAAAVDQISTWGIERNDKGWVADAFLYCHEVNVNGWQVPLAPSWVIGERTHTVAKLVPQLDTKTFRIEIEQGVSEAEMTAVRGIREGKTWKQRGEGTWDDGVVCPVDHDGTWIRPDNRASLSSDVLRGSGGLRRWENDDLVPRPDDVFQERLYCIRWRLPNLGDLLWEEQRVNHDPSYNGRPIDNIAREIDGFFPFIGADDQATLQTIREADWLSDAARCDRKRLEYERLKSLGPKVAGGQAIIDAAKAKWEQDRDSIRQRESAVAAVMRSLPETIYASPTDSDIAREHLVVQLLKDRFADWQSRGYIPSGRIEAGDKTDEPIRTRGYTYWHHLFNPRQLLTLGLFAYLTEEMRHEGAGAVACSLAIGKLADWKSRLSAWLPQAVNEKGNQVFVNQALNTLANYSARPISKLDRAWLLDIGEGPRISPGHACAADARAIDECCDLWLTDPPFADAINYQELSEFFLSWYQGRIEQMFPEWYGDSKRALAVVGSDETFRLAMVECYRNFATHMPDNGLQVVMFTHTDAQVWADLALVLWAAGLRVTAAWTIATETDVSGIRQGNYVQGTVLLVLRKQTGTEWGDLTDIFPEVQAEVERQLESMNSLDDRDDPNFSDSDYQLAAYAASLRVLTRYKQIEEIDVEREIRRVRGRNDESPLTAIIKKAVKIASDYLVPNGIENAIWRSLSPDERLYVKGIEVESHGDYRNGVYMEFANGYGVRDYRIMLNSSEANKTRLKTPSEMKSSSLSGEGFPSSLLRQVLFAVFKTAESDDPADGRTWLVNEVRNYWDKRTTIVALLTYLTALPSSSMTHWTKDREAAELLAGLLVNDTF